MSTTPFSALIDAAKEAKFTVIPASDYPVVIRDASATKASTGKDMIKFSAKVLVGPHKGAGLLGQQVLTTDNPVALAMFFKTMEALGIDEATILGLPPAADGGPNMAALAALMKGKTAVATVSVGQWNDEDRNYVDKLKKPGPEVQAAIDQALSSGDPFAGAAGAGAGGGAADPFAGGAPAGDPLAEGKKPGDPF